MKNFMPVYMTFIVEGNIYSRDILKFINYHNDEYKIKMQVVSLNLYVHCLDEALSSRKPNIMTFSITGT